MHLRIVVFMGFILHTNQQRHPNLLQCSDIHVCVIKSQLRLLSIIFVLKKGFSWHRHSAAQDKQYWNCTHYSEKGGNT